MKTTTKRKNKGNRILVGLIHHSIETYGRTSRKYFYDLLTNTSQEATNSTRSSIETVKVSYSCTENMEQIIKAHKFPFSGQTPLQLHGKAIVKSLNEKKQPTPEKIIIKLKFSTDVLYYVQNHQKNPHEIGPGKPFTIMAA